MNPLILKKLKVLQSFQKKYPTSHIGGSLGLMIRGVDLQRNLSRSDLDMVIDEAPADLEQRAITTGASGADFDLSIKEEHGEGQYTRIDIRVTPEPSFEVVEYEGWKYNVSKLRDILFWKKKYADKGVEKHINDLVAIETGQRPVRLEEPITSDDLPF